MKLLFICTVPTDKNGITNVIFNLLKGFGDDDFEIGYVAINEPDEFYRKQLGDLGVKLFVIPRKLSNPLSYIYRLSKAARSYDIIHIHGNSATMILEMIAAKFAGVPLRIAHSHNTTCSSKIIDRLARPLFYALCNGRLACGYEAGKWLFRRRDFKIVKNGVDTSKFRFNQSSRDLIRKSLGWDNMIIIANVANFVEAKNHEFLINVFSELHKRQPNFRLLLLGIGPLMDKAQQQAKDLGVYDYICFAGSIPNISDYLSAIDLIVMPSTFEGLPLTLVEEQANGLKAVVSDVITHDADLTGNLQFIPLKNGINYWVDQILSYQTVERNESVSDDCIDRIKKAGYDIYFSANELKNFYKTKLINYNG